MPGRMKSALMAALLLAAPAGAAEGKWENLLASGKLSDWKIKFTGEPFGVNYRDTFRIEDGELRVNYSGYETFSDHFGHIFWPVPHSHYRLRFEYRFYGEQVAGGPAWGLRNNGVMVHSQAPETMALGQPFPVSIEVQLLGHKEFEPTFTGNVCTPGTHLVLNGKLETEHCINSAFPAISGDGWVKAEILVKGDELIQHWINGTLVMEYTKPQYDLTYPDTQALKPEGTALKGGYIAFQAESHPTAIRNIELMVLDGD